MASIALIVSEVVSAGLAFLLVYFFFRAYRLTRSIFLLGLPVGFSLLSSSYIFLGIFLLLEGVTSFERTFMWLRLITQSYGFAYIAFTYYFSSRAERANIIYRPLFYIISISSGISILLVFGAVYITPPFMAIPSVQIIDEYFRIGNLIFLGYIIYHIVKHLELQSGSIRGLIWSSLAFSLLWLAQYSLMIWGIDSSQTAFIGAHGARFVSLSLFIYIYYSSWGVRK